MYSDQVMLDMKKILIPEEFALNKEIRKTLLGALDALAREEQSAIYLFYCSSFPIEQIVEITDLPVSVIIYDIILFSEAIEEKIFDLKKNHPLESQKQILFKEMVDIDFKESIGQMQDDDFSAEIFWTEEEINSLDFEDYPPVEYSMFEAEKDAIFLRIMDQLKKDGCISTEQYHGYYGSSENNPIRETDITAP